MQKSRVSSSLSPLLHLASLESLPQVLEPRVRILDTILPGLQTPESVHHGSYQAMLPFPIRATLPPHATSQVMLLNPFRLLPRHLAVVIRDQMPLDRIITVRCSRLFVILLIRACQRKSLVIENAVLPTALSDTAVRFPKAVRVLKGTAVERHPQYDL